MKAGANHNFMTDNLAVDALELLDVAGTELIFLQLLTAVLATADGDLTGELGLSGLQPFSINKLVEI